MKPLAWLIEEYDSQGKMLWYGIVMSEPTELSWYKDLKKKTHLNLIFPKKSNKLLNPSLQHQKINSPTHKKSH